MDQQIEKSLREEWCMRFETDHPEGDAYSGIAFYSTDSFIAIGEYRDFAYDGTMIFPKRNIVEIRDSGYEACENAILRHSGEFDRLVRPPWIFQTKTLRDVFEELMRHDVWPAVETMRGDPPDTALYIGSITEVRKDAFVLNCYDAEGDWEYDYQIDLDDVFRIEIDSIYCSHFNAYMRDKNPPKSG